jgi:hypothetical protein
MNSKLGKMNVYLKEKSFKNEKNTAINTTIYGENKILVFYTSINFSMDYLPLTTDISNFLLHCSHVTRVSSYRLMSPIWYHPKPYTFRLGYQVSNRKTQERVTSNYSLPVEVIASHRDTSSYHVP